MNLKSNVPEVKMMYVAKIKMFKSLDAIEHHQKVVIQRINEIKMFDEIAKNRKTFPSFCGLVGL